MCIWAVKRKMYKQYKEENLLLTWLNVSKKNKEKLFMCFECPILESSNTHTLSGVSLPRVSPKGRAH